MTVVRLADGGLWCHSPIAPAPELFAQIDALDEVRHLVSPNKIHYAHISERRCRVGTGIPLVGLKKAV